jgi:hypothetical protein
VFHSDQPSLASFEFEVQFMLFFIQTMWMSTVRCLTACFATVSSTLAAPPVPHLIVPTSLHCVLCTDSTLCQAVPSS